MPKPRSGESSSTTVSAYVKFTSEVVHRSALKNAKYNPRRLSDKARKRLKANIEKVGLIEPPVWNKRTGNLVGGHQRLAILDALQGSADYSLPVAAVNLSDKEEREQNIALNNASMQGEFDLPKLDALFREGVDVARTGFDEAEILNLFGTVPQGRADILDNIGDRLKHSQETFAKIKAKDGTKHDCEFYRVLVFDSDDEAKAFSAKVNATPGARFLNGRETGELIRGQEATPPGAAKGRQRRVAKSVS